MIALGCLNTQKQVRVPCWLFITPVLTKKIGFSPANTPHLAPALELDSAIADFSASLAASGLPTVISSENDLNAVIDAFDKVFRGLSLWQYYVLNRDHEKDSVKTALLSGKTEPWKGSTIAGKDVAELADIFRSEKEITGLGKFASRFGVQVEAAVAAGFVQAAFTELNDPEAQADAWARVVDVLNVSLYQEWEEDTKVAIDNVRNRVKYTRLDPHGPKLGEITKEHVVFSYPRLPLLIFMLIGTPSSNFILHGSPQHPMQTLLFTQSQTTDGSGMQIPCKTLLSYHPRHIFAVKSLFGATASNFVMVLSHLIIHGSGNI